MLNTTLWQTLKCKLFHPGMRRIEFKHTKGGHFSATYQCVECGRLTKRFFYMGG